MSLQQQARRARRAIRHKPRAHMIHIGKTGGTALKNTLRPVSSDGRYEIVLHRHVTCLDDIPVGEKVFFVIRDPIERYVSGFNSRLRRGRPTHDTPWTPTEEIAFEEFDTADALGSALSSADVALRARAFTAMTVIRHVRDSYWEWFRSRELLDERLDDLLLVVWCPDLTASFPRLRELLGLPESVALATDELSAHRSPSGMDRSLSPLAADNLERWYGREFAFVDYCAGLDCFFGPSRESAAVAPPGVDVQATVDGPATGPAAARRSAPIAAAPVERL